MSHHHEHDHFLVALRPDYHVSRQTLYFLDYPLLLLEESTAALLQRIADGPVHYYELVDQAQGYSGDVVRACLQTLRTLGYIAIYPEAHYPVDPGQARICVVSPHMDDAFLSLGGMLLKLAPRHALQVVDIFGDDPWITLDARFELSPADKNRFRHREEQFNAHMAGCGLEIWGYSSCMLRGYPDWNAPYAPDLDRRLHDELTTRLADQISAHDYTLVLWPLGIGGHTDHRLIREVGLAVCEQLGARGAPCRCAFYEDLPYATRKDYWYIVNDFLLAHRQQLRPLAIDISAQASNKLSLLHSYRSQLVPNEPYLVYTYAHREAITSGIGWLEALSAQHIQQPPAARQVERIWFLDSGQLPAEPLLEQLVG